MKVLILGCSGFIGRSLYEYFSDKYEVIAPSSASLDMSDDIQVGKYLEINKFDVVLNALDSRLDYNHPAYSRDKLRMFLNLAKYSDLYGKQLFFGSGAEYCRDLPISDVTEEDFDRKVPTDSYEFAVYTCSKYAMLYKNIYNYRLFGVFGCYEDYAVRFISGAVIKALLGLSITIRKDCVFDYLHIDDVCEYVKYFIENGLKERSYNVTSGCKYRLSEIAGIVREMMGNDVSVFICKDGLGKEYTGSNSRILKETKIASHDIKVGINKLFDYYSKNMKGLDIQALLYGRQ